MKKKHSTVSIKKTSGDRALFNVGVQGFGEIRLSGTNAFINEAVPMVQDVVLMLLTKYFNERRDKGLSSQQVADEFFAALRTAAKKAGIKP